MTANILIFDKLQYQYLVNKGAMKMKAKLHNHTLSKFNNKIIIKY